MYFRRVIRLSEAQGAGRTVRCVSSLAALTLGEESAPERWVTLTRTGDFTDPRYGRFSITPAMLTEMVKNFDAGVYGQKIFLDVAHNPSGGAAAEVLALSVDGQRLRAKVRFTPYGVDAVKNKGFAYLSAEYHEAWRSNEQGKEAISHGCVLLGAGLVTRPCIKNLDPVQLSEGNGDVVTVLHPKLFSDLMNEVNAMKGKYLEALRKKCGDLKLSGDATDSLVTALGAAMDGDGDEKKCEEQQKLFEAIAESLAKQLGEKPAHVTVTMGAGGVTMADVQKFLSEQADAAKKLAEGTAVKRELLLAEISKGVTDVALAKSLAEDLSDVISPEMTEARVKELAERQVKRGKELQAAKELQALGFDGRRGTSHISVDDSNSVKALQESVDRRLGLTTLRASQRYWNTGGVLLEENKAFAEKVLAEWDAQNAHRLRSEHRMLAAGDGMVSDVAVPAAFERTVIREALYNLVGLSFVDVGTYAFGASALVPYSYRDTTGAGVDSVRQFEGQSIPRAGIKQATDTAYPIPQKLAFEVSDEMRYLTANGMLDWDTVSENARNATRIIGEDTERLIFNEVQRAADEYSLAAVTNEATATANGTNRIFPLGNFPVVRPRKVYDLQGNQVGAPQNPITVTLAGSAVTEWSLGVSAGTYFVLDYNLGEIRFVNAAGALITPTNSQAIVTSYSYTTNVQKWDMDLGGLKTDEKYDDLLYRVGLRKSVIEDQRYYHADMQVMSGTVQAAVEQARQFSANYSRPGTDLSVDGNLGRIKGIPAFKTSAPGLWMADQRIVIGQRGLTRFRMMKPWAMGILQDQKDSNGRFTGKKEAYGDQFVVVHTPTPLKAGYTSIALYSSSARVARAS
jgi:hypothetical protein